MKAVAPSNVNNSHNLRMTFRRLDSMFQMNLLFMDYSRGPMLECLNLQDVNIYAMFPIAPFSLFPFPILCPAK